MSRRVEMGGMNCVRVNLRGVEGAETSLGLFTPAKWPTAARASGTARLSEVPVAPPYARSSSSRLTTFLVMDA